MGFSLPGFGRRSTSTSDRSFLPEEYLQRRAERRTNALALALFSVVTVGVIGAFLVTSQQWRDVKRYQEAINVRYAQAAKDIEQLKTLEGQKSSLLQKAELTTALIDRVPKSILLAELTNRMPLDVTLLELEVKSTRLNDQSNEVVDPKKAKNDKAGKAARTAKGDAKEVKAVVAPPRFKTKLAITGVTVTHNSVADFVAALQQCALITGVELKFSEKTIIENQDMNRFRIEADIKPDVDTRSVEPLAAPRIDTEPFNFGSAPVLPGVQPKSTAGAGEGSEP
jgi:Tfp pilus assembly protein PilN